MAVEIERKFLITSDAWRADVKSSAVLEQAYLAETGRLTIRVRTSSDGTAFLTIKTANPGRTRLEFEYPIPVDDAAELLANRSSGLISKRRYIVMHTGQLWEIDEFLGENTGLVLAEIELDDHDAEFERPFWLGAEVTSDARYYNAALAKSPYGTWVDANRAK